jgi:hypothetical protein
MMHSLTLICNLFVITVDNCFGIRDKHSGINELSLEEHLLEQEVNTDIMDDLPEPASPTRKDEIRSKRLKQMLKVHQVYTLPNEDFELPWMGKQSFTPPERLIEGALLNPETSGSILDFIVDDKIERRIVNGVNTDYFTIDIFVGEKKIRRGKKSLDEIRVFDMKLRRSVNYDIPSLSMLSRLF